MPDHECFARIRCSKLGIVEEHLIMHGHLSGSTEGERGLAFTDGAWLLSLNKKWTMSNLTSFCFFNKIVVDDVDELLHATLHDSVHTDDTLHDVQWVFHELCICIIY